LILSNAGWNADRAWQHKIRNLIRKLEANGIIDSSQAFQAEFSPLKFRREP
jgi:hypothetical protein